MFKGFREFAIRGNIIDLAVGVVLGTSFGKIVNSVVNDLIMPPFGLLLGKVDFSNLFINLSGQPVSSLAEAKRLGLATLNYGAFINTVIEFGIIAFSIYIFISQINKFRKAQPPVPAVNNQEKLLEEIRDILKAERK